MVPGLLGDPEGPSPLSFRQDLGPKLQPRPLSDISQGMLQADKGNLVHCFLRSKTRGKPLSSLLSSPQVWFSDLSRCVEQSALCARLLEPWPP